VPICQIVNKRVPTAVPHLPPARVSASLVMTTSRGPFRYRSGVSARANARDEKSWAIASISAKL
jgi:hypothetical protein